MITRLFNKLFGTKKKENKSIDEIQTITSCSESDRSVLGIIKSRMPLNNIALPWALSDQARKLIPLILGAENFVAPLDLTKRVNKVDFYCLWGSTDNAYTAKIVNLAKSEKKPIIRLEYGFISSYDIALSGAIQYSLVLSDNRIYYDSRGNLQKDFLESEFELTKDEKGRAEKALELIHRYGITKYTLNLRSTEKQKCQKDRILLIDQRFGDNSLRYAGADQSNFEKMVDYAVRQNKEILVKLHPDALVGNKQSCLKDLVSKHKKIKIIADTRNPFDLFDEVSDVYVVCSQVGLEAALYGKNVHCFGKAFYAGYGFTQDHVECQKKRKRSAIELFYVYYIIFSRYYIPGIGSVELEQLVEYLKYIKDSGVKPSLGFNFSSTVKSDEKNIEMSEKELRVLFILAGGRWGATGRYIQYLAWYLQKQGAKILVLCEGGTKNNYSGVEWRQIKFQGIGLEKNLLNEIKKFNPNILYENGVRTIPQRAALQLKFIFENAKLVLQNEDDDIQVFEKKYPSESLNHLTLLDHSNVSPTEVADFLRGINWERFVKMLLDPYYDRWIDPLLRIICYRQADLYTSIWYPLGEELKEKFGKNFVVVPPVLPYDKYSKIANSSNSLEIRKKILVSNGIKEESLIVFLPGTIYEYSEEFKLFVNVLNKLNLRRNVVVFLMSKGNVNVKKLLGYIVNKKIKIVDLGKPEDDEYLEVLIASDLVCCPGFNDRFNRLRLPSRLVKPLMMGKPVITYKTGFGESLSDGENVVLLTEDTEVNWCKVLERAFNEGELESIGKRGQEFAKENLDAKKVAKNLYDVFLKLLK